MSIERCVVNRSMCTLNRNQHNNISLSGKSIIKPKHVCNLKGKHNATIVIYSLLGYKVRGEIWMRIRYQPQLTFRIVCGESSRAQYITMLMFCPWHVFKCSCYMIGGETWTIYIVLKHQSKAAQCKPWILQ